MTTQNADYVAVMREQVAQRDSIILDLEAEIRKALNELGVPDGTYPAPVAHAVGILVDALDDDELTERYLYANPGLDVT